MWRRLLALPPLVGGVGLLVLVALASPRARQVPQEPTLLLQDRHGEYLGEVGIGPDERMGFWPTGVHRCEVDDRDDCLPPRIVAATLVIEDHRFDHHPGIDAIAVVRAAQQNLEAGHVVSGASTVAMQVARLQSPGPRTFGRKAVEAVTALFLTERLGRDGVLARYLQLAPYGNNVYGIRYAARRYFDKPVRDLSWAETALLAGLPQAPGDMNPYTDAGLQRATHRANTILDRLLHTGQLSAADHARALEELDGLYFPPKPIRPRTTLHPVLALDGIASADPVVETSLDLRLQGRTQRSLYEAVQHWAPRGAEQGAVVILDRHTLQVRAAVGSTRWTRAGQAGAVDFTRTPRYPGSTLKPLLYATALDRGAITPNTVLDDLTRGPEGIANADRRFLGPMLPRQALANSRNIPAVFLANEVGIGELYGVWSDLGLHDGSVDVGHYGVGIAIGGMPVTLLDLATAYAALANDGQFQAASFLATPEPRPTTRIFTADHARLVTAWLADPMARMPSFPRAGHTEFPFAASVKTGTSADYRDSWAVGYTDRYVVGVWIGHPDWRPMKGMSGYRGGARVLHTVLLDLHADEADGLTDHRPPGPEGWVRHAVCPLSGDLATELCDGQITEWFAPRQVPVHDCGVHQLVNGRAVVSLPPRYAAWLADAGLPAAPRALAAHETPITVQVLAPADGMRIIRDPEVPASRATLRLQAAVDPPVEQVVWYVDGAPFAVVEPPYVARWPVVAGEHTFEARVPFRNDRSAAVAITAR